MNRRERRRQAAEERRSLARFKRAHQDSLGVLDIQVCDSEAFKESRNVITAVDWTTRPERHCFMCGYKWVGKWEVSQPEYALAILRPRADTKPGAAAVVAFCSECLRGANPYEFIPSAVTKSFGGRLITPASGSQAMQ